MKHIGNIQLSDTFFLIDQLIDHRTVVLSDAAWCDESGHGKVLREMISQNVKSIYKIE